MFLTLKSGKAKTIKTWIFIILDFVLYLWSCKTNVYQIYVAFWVLIILGQKREKSVIKRQKQGDRCFEIYYTAFFLEGKTLKFNDYFIEYAFLFGYYE